MPGVQLTAKQRILVAVVSAVVVAVTQVFGVDADVGAVTLDLARWTRSVSWREQRKDSYFERWILQLSNDASSNRGREDGSSC